jgi:hypothetical protein
LTAQAVDIGLDAVGARQGVGQIAQASRARFRRCLQFLRNARRGGVHGLARGIAAASAAARASRASDAARSAARSQRRPRIGAFRTGERIGGLSHGAPRHR